MFQGFKSKREEKVFREAAFEIYEKNQLKNILKALAIFMDHVRVLNDLSVIRFTTICTAVH